MNDRIRELAEQAVESVDIVTGNESLDDELAKMYIPDCFSEKFAELIVQECKENFGKVWYEQGLDIRGAELGKFMTRFDQHFGGEE